jgi:hypothetical protein
MASGEGKTGRSGGSVAPMVSGSRHSQADVMWRNESGQVRTPSIEKKNDLSFTRPWGFVYTAATSQRDLNAVGTAPTFYAYSSFLMRKSPLS